MNSGSVTVPPIKQQVVAICDLVERLPTGHARMRRPNERGTAKIAANFLTEPSSISP